MPAKKSGRIVPTEASATETPATNPDVPTDGGEVAPEPQVYEWVPPASDYVLQGKIVATEPSSEPVLYAPVAMSLDNAITVMSKGVWRVFINVNDNSVVLSDDTQALVIGNLEVPLHTLTETEIMQLGKAIFANWYVSIR
jgi:hypothetical protein